MVKVPQYALQGASGSALYHVSSRLACTSLITEPFESSNGTDREQIKTEGRIRVRLQPAVQKALEGIADACRQRTFVFVSIFRQSHEELSLSTSTYALCIQSEERPRRGLPCVFSYSTGQITDAHLIGVLKISAFGMVIMRR